MVEREKNVRVAAAQYRVDPVGTWSRYEEKTERWVAEAREAGAELLVFPEYAALELASLFPERVRSDADAQIEAIQEYLPAYRDHFARLAARYDVYVVAGSFPVRVEGGSYANRAFLFGPDGGYDYQDKLTMTRFEQEEWPIDAGTAIKVFETRFGLVGVNICYDSEFPFYARKQVEQGAWIILVPSSTGTEAGYHRVRIGCQARALENQCFVVQSPTIGDARWSEAVGRTHGAAGVYGPVDAAVDDDGIYAMGRMDEPRWVFSDLRTPQLDRVRTDGETFNHRDWEHQHAFQDRAVVRSGLGALDGRAGLEGVTDGAGDG